MCLAWEFVKEHDRAYGLSVLVGVLLLLGITIPIALKVCREAGALLLPLLFWCMYQLSISCKEIELLE